SMSKISQNHVDQREQVRRRSDISAADHLEPVALRVVDGLYTHRIVRLTPPLGRTDEEGSQPVGGLSCQVVDDDDRRDLRERAPSVGIGLQRHAGKLLERLRRHPIALPHLDRLELAVADVAPHGFGVQIELRRDLLRGEEQVLEGSAHCEAAGSDAATCSSVPRMIAASRRKRAARSEWPRRSYCAAAAACSSASARSRALISAPLSSRRGTSAADPCGTAGAKASG